MREKIKSVLENVRGKIILEVFNSNNIHVSHSEIPVQDAIEIIADSENFMYHEDDYIGVATLFGNGFIYRIMFPLVTMSSKNT